MSWAFAPSIPSAGRLSDLWSAVESGASQQLQHIAASVGNLAAHDLTQAAQALHDALTPPGSRDDAAGIIAPNLNSSALDALARLPLGREVVRIVHTVYATTSFGTAQPDVLNRLAAAIAGFAHDAVEQGQCALFGILDTPNFVQTLRPQRLREDHASGGGGAGGTGGSDTAPSSASNETANRFTDGLLGGLESFGDGLKGAVANVERGVCEATVGSVSCLLEGRIGEASASAVRGTDHALFQSTESVCLGVRDGAQAVCNGATDTAGPVGRPVRWFTDRLFDVGNTVVDTGFGLARDLYRLIPDTCTGFIGDMERTIRLAAAGNGGRALAEFGLAFVHVPVRLLGGLVDMTMRSLQCVASVALTIVGAEPPGRKLTPEERAYLERTYGDSIDYDKVRVKAGGPLNDAMAAHTVGNTIYMPSDDFNADGTLTAEGLQTLGHETGHVWQNQNGGGDYIHDALGAQLLAFLGTGNRDNAYDWRQALADGETFETMNDEQRARAMEDLALALADDGVVSADEANYDDATYSDEEVAFLNSMAEKLKVGQGAG